MRVREQMRERQREGKGKGQDRERNKQRPGRGLSKQGRRQRISGPSSEVSAACVGGQEAEEKAAGSRGEGEGGSNKRKR